jgi:Mn2+/Fe2+ NRAMP family transporter
LTAISWLVAVAIAALNAWLLVQTIGGWIAG